MTTEKKKTATKKKPAAKAKAKPVVMSKDTIQILNGSSKSFSCVLSVLKSVFETERDLLVKGADDFDEWICDCHELRVFMLRGDNDRWAFLFTDIIDNETLKECAEKALGGR